MDIHITNKTNMSWEAVYVIEKVWQLFSKHRVSNNYRQSKCGYVKAIRIMIQSIIKNIMYLTLSVIALLWTII